MTSSSPPHPNSSKIKVQHDQIPQVHSSVSYKQELMDASLLLDGLNEVLCEFDSDKQLVHSLQPQYMTHGANDFLFTNTKAKDSSKNKNRSKKSKKQTLKLKKHRSKRNKKRKAHSQSHELTLTPSSPMAIGLQTIGPHQTYIVKDDTHLRSHQKYKSNIHISEISDIPRFLKQNRRRLQLLKEMVEIKRTELERVTKRHDHTVNSIVDLYVHACDAIISLRKQHRQLSQYAEQLSREGRKRIEKSDKMLQSLHTIEQQRKELLNKIETPAWEIKHHFHILSYEHFRGNQQPHLLEIAEVLPTRLQIAAIAHASSNRNDRLLMTFHRTRKERDLLFDKLAQIDTKRNLTHAHLKDYKNMMTIIKKHIGESRLNKLRKLRGEAQKQKEVRQQQVSKSAQSAAAAQPRPLYKSVFSYSRMRPIPRIRTTLSPRLITNNVISSPSPFPAPKPIAGSDDSFRLNYLRHIGIQSSKKVKFNLIDFLIQVNTYLGVAKANTISELKDLQNVSNLINPVTGVVKNLTNNTNNTGVEENANGEITHEEKKEIGDDETKPGVKKKRKTKSKHKLVMKEKHIGENILSVIDRQVMEVKEDVLNEKKKVYNVTLKNGTNKNKNANANTTETATNETETETETKINGNLRLDDLEIPEPRITNLDEAHSDWGVLAKHLKDCSKESSKRKQILKQLERILHVREGLSVGFEQLQQTFFLHKRKEISKSKKIKFMRSNRKSKK